MTKHWLEVTFVGRAHEQPSAEYEFCRYNSVVRLLDPTDLEEGARFDRKIFSPGFDAGANSISLNTMHRGLERLFERVPDPENPLLDKGWVVLPQRADLRAKALALDSLDFDSVDADVILQLGFFGDVQFG